MRSIQRLSIHESCIGAILTSIVLAMVLFGCQNKPKTTPTTEPSRPAKASTTPTANKDDTSVAIAPGGEGGSPTLQKQGDAQATPTVPAPQVSETPAASPTPNGPKPTPTPANCLNQAVYVDDVTIPDGTMVRPNERFTKTWKVQNSGTCDWGDGYTMVFSGGDIMNAGLNKPLQPPIRAGEIGEVSVDMTAPSRGGRQTGYWMLQDPAGRTFGMGFTSRDMLWVQINVAYLDEAGNPGFVPVVFQPTPQGNSTGGDDNPTITVDEGGTETQPTPAVESAGGSDGEASPTQEGDGSGGSDNGGGSGQQGTCKYTQNSGYVTTILRLVNQARQQNGLGPLFLQDQLTAAAVAHSADMGCNRYVDHNGSDGTTWYDRVRLQGYSAPMSARENIYVGDPAFGGDANGAFNWWMGSQVHRDNILFANVTECGIGYVYVLGSPYGGYYTLVLGKR